MTTNDQSTSDPAPVRVLLAGPDTLYFSCDAVISHAMREQLDEEKVQAHVAAMQRGAHCPTWLGARVCPQGARGGYAFLIETGDFSVKLLGERIQHRPGVYIEMRSHALHTHVGGPQGACEAALTWVRETLFADQAETLAPTMISFAAAKLSRADIHIDWQGGYTPTLSGASEELRRFIRPGKTKWAFHGQGLRPTGYSFGRGHIQARLYNKTHEAAEKANDAYAALLAARNGEAFDPHADVWRLEFQVRREGAKGFKLYAPPEEDDDEAQIEAELCAEDLQHIGTLPRFFARMNDLFQYLTAHWLRLVEDTGSANRSRWPLHPTWQALREQFAQAVQGLVTEPLTQGWQQGDEQAQQRWQEEKRVLVRGAKYSGKNRVLRRLAEKEVERLTRRCEHYQARQGAVPRWVRRGMGERFVRVQHVEHRVQMLLGVLSAKGVLPLEFKPAYSVGDLLVQHLEELEVEAEKKGGMEQVLADHFAKVYKVWPSGLPAMGRAA